MDMDRAKKIAGDIVSDVKAAGKVATLQSKRTKLQSLDLPAAFRTFGESVFHDDSLREAYVTHYDKIASLDDRLSELTASPDVPAENVSLTDKAKRAAAKAQAVAEKQLCLKQRSTALGELGKAAYRSNSFGPDDSGRGQVIADLESQIEAIDQEIASLESNASTSFLSPTRILVAGGLVLLTALIAAPFLIDDDDIPSQTGISVADATDANVADAAKVANPIYHSPVFARFFRNDEAFAEEIKDKQVRTFGKVVSIGSRTYTKEVDGQTETFNNSIVRLEGLSKEYTIWCDLTSVDPNVRSLMGKTVAIEGTCWGLSAANSEWEHIAFKKCEIIAMDQDATPESFAALGWTAVVEEPAPLAPEQELEKVVGRRLEASVNSAGASSSKRHFSVIRLLNNGLTSVSCIATESELVIDFDFEVAPQISSIMQTYPLLVRLFDRNGQYLTHFTTSEKFTSHRGVFEDLDTVRQRLVDAGVQSEADKFNVRLLSPKGNRLVYTVNIRDLRDASMVEVGYTSP